MTDKLPDINGWQIKHIQDISEVSGGSTPSTNEPLYWKGDIPFVTPTDITALKNSKYIEKTRRYITEKGLNTISSGLLEPGTILLTSRATLGKVAINNVPLVTNQGFANIKPSSNINGLWLFHYLRAQKRELERLSSGSTFKEISKKSIKRMKIPVPPLIEQHGIVEVLGTVDECIHLTEAVIERAEKLKRGLMQQLLTIGIGHTKYKDSDVGLIPNNWDVVKLRDLAYVKRGASPRPITDPKYWAQNGRGWVRITDVTSSYKYLKKTTQYLTHLGESKSVKVNPGDVIMSICATIGKPIILDMEACIHDGFVTFRNLSKRIKNEFLYYLLQHKEPYFLSKKQIGTQGNINSTIVGNTQISIPNIDEQEKIIQILNNVNDIISLEFLRKNYLTEFKRGLIQSLLSGKIRVELKGDELHRIRDGREADN